MLAEPRLSGYDLKKNKDSMGIMRKSLNNDRGLRLPAVIAAAVMCLHAGHATALKTDDNTLIEGAKLCTRYLPRHERQYGIPEHLLAAIASTESGRFHHALGMNLPWPWTINVEGMGHFYDTKEEAIEAVRSYQSRGFSSIDVGCMQVNLHHHPGAFASLDQAFDPAYNIAYAAQFLKKNFQEEGNNWRKATADYHSRTLAYGSPYANLVYGAWSKIIGKVADARAGKPILNASAAMLPKPPRVSPTYRSLRMHSISVSRDTTRENGVLVVRPEYGQQQASTLRQGANMDSDFIIQPVSSQAMRDAQAPELSAIAPKGVAAARQEAHNAQIVKINADGVASSKGQFEPSGRSASSPPSATQSASSGSGAEAKSPFIFNN